MAKRKRKPQIRSQSLQVSVKIKRPRGHTINPKLIQKIIEDFIDDGEIAEGFEIEMIIWHKELVSGQVKDYRYYKNSDFHEILDKARRIGIVPKVFFPASD